MFVPLHSQAWDLITGLQAGMQIQTLMQEGIREAKKAKNYKSGACLCLCRGIKCHYFNS